MTLPARSASRYQSLRTSRLVLVRSAPLVRFLLFGLGLSLFLDQVRPLISDAQFTWGERRVMGIVAMFTIGGFGIAGWLAGRLLRAAAELIDVFIDAADAASRTADLIELQAIPALSRIANALERSAPSVRDEERAKALDAIRAAIGSESWGRAEHLLDAFNHTHGDAPEAAALAAELTEGRAPLIADLREQLDSVVAANDPVRVIEIRDLLTEHLRGEALNKLDRRLARWLLGVVQKRIRGGTVRPEDADLAARIADSFADTAEGTSLSAALPNLRRSAGLCPLCGRPYRGADDACPQCLGNGAGRAGRARGGKPLPKDQP